MDLNKFKLHSQYLPAGDQPAAIDQLVNNINQGLTNMVLLGVTGSGKTYTVANVIERTQKPTLVISHNKTLAAQLYQEFRDFFPKNAVEYFVSYYDYYQPESYLPASDTYIEKEAQRNEEIDKLRLGATMSLSTRKDVIVVSSVSCIYNLGSPVEYQKNILEIVPGMKIRLKDLLFKLTMLQYSRSDYDLKRSTYRVTGDNLDIVPSYGDYIIRVELLDEKIQQITKLNQITGEIIEFIKMFVLYPAKHYVTAEENRDSGIEAIKRDLKLRLTELKNQNKVVEAYRLQQRTMSDLEMIKEVGFCNGIENYSRYFDGRKQGDAPFTLLDYFSKDYLLVIDESHITIPQIGGMFNGDKSRKQTLVDYGFRLPSALDNRPLQFSEFLERAAKNNIYVSATPNEYEMDLSKNSAKLIDSRHSDPEFTKGEESQQNSIQPIVELIVRPTGLIDPIIEIHKSEGQIPHLISQIEETIKKGQRILVTTLTKRMAEDLSNYLDEKNFKVAYLHSDIITLERSDILDKLRRGNYDVLIGINLLREGLDLPEVSLVAVLDADKEGFLRSRTSLIQTMGRAARHLDGRVILYADTITKSIKAAVDEVERRREIQVAYNKEHNIDPKSIIKPIRDVVIEHEKEEVKNTNYLEVQKEGGKDMDLENFEFRTMNEKDKKAVIKRLEEYMKQLASDLDFEKAVIVRDKIKELRKS